LLEIEPDDRFVLCDQDPHTRSLAIPLEVDA
jgi:hypothetical protein